MTPFLLLLALTVSVEGPPWPDGLREGLSPAQVRSQLGAPARISRQILSHRVIEHWHYGPPRRYRLVFDCPRGRAPRLIEVQRQP